MNLSIAFNDCSNILKISIDNVINISVVSGKQIHKLMHPLKNRNKKKLLQRVKGEIRCKHRLLGWEKLSKNQISLWDLLWLIIII